MLDPAGDATGNPEITAKLGKLKIMTSSIVLSEMPRIVRIELTNQCNLQCPHCRHHSPEKKTPENYPDYYKNPYGMSKEQISAVMEEIADFKPSVTLNVANEPLVAKHFRFAVEEVKRHGMAGTFNTNGLGLTADLSSFLVDQQFDSVNVSIDATTPETLKLARGFKALDILIRNVERLISARGTNPLPRIGVTFVIMDYNEEEIPQFLEFWRSRVDVIRLNGYISDKRPDMTILPGVDEFDMSSRIPCKQLFRDIVIRANGDVTPCVITSEDPDPDLTFGNIFTDGGVRAVWHGSRFNEWRRLHEQGKWGEIPYCSSCDYWIESHSVRETLSDNFLIRNPSPYTVFYNPIDRLGNWDRVNLPDRQGMGEDASGTTMAKLAEYEID